MRRLTETEQLALDRIAQNGGSYSPSNDALAHPDIISILRSLKSKKRIYEVEDTDVPTFRLTQAGRNEVRP